MTFHRFDSISGAGLVKSVDLLTTSEPKYSQDQLFWEPEERSWLRLETTLVFGSSGGETVYFGRDCVFWW